MLQGRNYLWSICAMWLAVCAVSASPALAEDTVSIKSVGFDGYFSVGRATQLLAEVTCEAAGEYRVVVDAPDPQGNRVLFRSEPVTITANEPTTVPVLFQCGQLGATLRVSVIDGDDNAVVQASQRFPRDSGLISSSVSLVVAIGQPGGLVEYLKSEQIFIRFADTRDRRSRQEAGENSRTKDEARKLANEIASRIRETGVFESDRDESTSDTASQPASVISALRSLSTDGGIGVAESSDGFYVLRRDRATDEFIEEQLGSRLVVDLTPEQFPADPRALDGLRVLVIGEEFESLTEQQAKCIAHWVQFGGHLIVSIPRANETYLNSELRKAIQQWVPVGSGTTKIDELPDLEGFTDNIAPVPFNRKSFSAARLESNRGKVLVKGPDGPLIQQAAAGFGRVTMIALDTTAGPVARWEALPILMRRITFDERRTTRDNKTQSAAIGHNGITDLATQLHASQADFPEIDRPSSWIAMGLILLYMLAIGPLDYLIVHRILRRPRLTWITFPLMVIGACVAGVMLARDRNGDEMRVNQTAIVDIDSTSNLAQVHSWHSIYSPQARRSKITTAPAKSLTATLGADNVKVGHLSWSGIPENVFGGMLRTAGASLGGVTYSVDNAEVSGIPTAVWSTCSVSNSWTGATGQKFDSSLRATSTGLLTGSFSHSLDQPIRNWIVAYGRNIYFPDRGDSNAETIPPGEWDPKACRSTYVAGYLRKEQAIEVRRKPGEGGETTKIQSESYDALSRDPVYVIRMMSLHEAAGGRNYTGLTNTMLFQMDWSYLAKLDRAVLIGEIDTPVADLSLDDEPLKATRMRTFIRVLLPVEPTQSK